MKKVLIIGGGPIGIFASWACGMYQMSPIIIDSLNKLGGQCSELYPDKYIYDIPAIKKLTGRELINNLIDQSNQFSKKVILNSKVTQIKKIDKEFQVTYICDNQLHHLVVSGIIIAAGRGSFDFKKAEFNNANLCEGKSLFYSVKDKNIFKNKIVTINGGGDSAADYAEQISYIAKKVYLVHRRNNFRCSDLMINKLRKIANLEIITPTTITNIDHKEGYITKIHLSNNKSLESNFLLCFYGLHTNMTNILNWNLNIEKDKIIVNENYATNIDGIYAVSDIANKKGDIIDKKLILHGFAEAYTAVYALSKFLNMQIKLHYSTSSILAN